MNRLSIILFALIISYSCSSLNNLTGKEFYSRSQNRVLSLNFITDSTCVMKNVFLCKDIDERFKEIIINTSYKRQGDIIILKNINCKYSNCVYPPTVDIPIQNSCNCTFLNKEGRESRKMADGRTFSSDYQKYGLVPNIDIDTLRIVRRSILYYHSLGEKGRFGFFFK